MTFSYLGYPKNAGYIYQGDILFSQCLSLVVHSLYTYGFMWGLLSFELDYSKSQMHSASWPYPLFFPFLSQVRYLVMLMWLAISQTQASRGERPGDEHVIMSDHGEAIDRTLWFSLSLSASLSICFLSPSLSSFSRHSPSHTLTCLH